MVSLTLLLTPFPVYCPHRDSEGPLLSSFLPNTRGQLYTTFVIWPLPTCQSPPELDAVTTVNPSSPPSTSSRAPVYTSPSFPFPFP